MCRRSGGRGKIRSVIQHQIDAATYASAGPGRGRHAAAVRRSEAPTAGSGGPEEPRALASRRVGDYVSARFENSGRNVGSALTPMLEFTRGHPQRSMMLAHYLWQRTPRGAIADEGTWVSALDQASADSAPLMRAIWRALTANERRMARAIAVTTTPLYSEKNSRCRWNQACKHRASAREPGQQRRRHPGERQTPTH